MRELTWSDGKPIVREYAVTCTPRQMRLALHRAGLLATVDQIAALDPEATITWEYATVIDRNSPLISALAVNPIRTFTPDEIDALFVAAQEI